MASRILGRASALRAAVAGVRAATAPASLPARPAMALRHGSVFVRNLPFGVTNEQVEEEVKDAIGKDVDLRVRLIVDRQTQRARGFGFIDAPDEFCEQIVQLETIEIMGRACFFTPAAERPERKEHHDNSKPSNSLLFRDLVESSEADLMEEFQEAGAIAVRILRDRETGESRGLTFVDFGTVDEAILCKEAVQADPPVFFTSQSQVLYARPRNDRSRGPPRGTSHFF